MADIGFLMSESSWCDEMKGFIHAWGATAEAGGLMFRMLTRESGGEYMRVNKMDLRGPAEFHIIADPSETLSNLGLAHARRKAWCEWRIHTKKVFYRTQQKLEQFLRERLGL